MGLIKETKIVTQYKLNDTRSKSIMYHVITTDTFSVYTNLTVRGYQFRMVPYNKSLYFQIGCKNFYITDIERLVALLKGKTSSVIMEKGLKKISKKTNSPIGNLIKTPIVSENDEYFIIKTLKAYPKSDYRIVEVPKGNVVKEESPGVFTLGHINIYNKRRDGNLKGFTEVMEALLMLCKETNSLYKLEVLGKRA